MHKCWAFFGKETSLFQSKQFQNSDKTQPCFHSPTNNQSGNLLLICMPVILFCDGYFACHKIIPISLLRRQSTSYFVCHVGDAYCDRWKQFEFIKKASSHLYPVHIYSMAEQKQNWRAVDFISIQARLLHIPKLTMSQNPWSFENSVVTKTCWMRHG